MIFAFQENAKNYDGHPTIRCPGRDLMSPSLLYRLLLRVNLLLIRGHYVPEPGFYGRLGLMWEHSWAYSLNRFHRRHMPLANLASFALKFDFLSFTGSSSANHTIGQLASCPLGYLGGHSLGVAWK
jgi:hypothetical protein